MKPDQNSVQDPDDRAMAGRSLACAGCGATFTCNVSGQCWCMDEPVRLPMPAAGGDCLCRDCLRTMAAQASSGES